MNKLQILLITCLIIFFVGLIVSIIIGRKLLKNLSQHKKINDLEDALLSQEEVFTEIKDSSYAEHKLSHDNDGYRIHSTLLDEDDCISQDNVKNEQTKNESDVSKHELPNEVDGDKDENDNDLEKQSAKKVMKGIIQELRLELGADIAKHAQEDLKALSNMDLDDLQHKKEIIQKKLEELESLLQFREECECWMRFACMTAYEGLLHTGHPPFLDLSDAYDKLAAIYEKKLQLIRAIQESPLSLLILKEKKEEWVSQNEQDNEYGIHVLNTLKGYVHNTGMKNKLYAQLINFDSARYNFYNWVRVKQTNEKLSPKELSAEEDTSDNSTMIHKCKLGAGLEWVPIREMKVMHYVECEQDKQILEKYLTNLPIDTRRIAKIAKICYANKMATRESYVSRCMIAENFVTQQSIDARNYSMYEKENFVPGINMEVFSGMIRDGGKGMEDYILPSDNADVSLGTCKGRGLEYIMYHIHKVCIKMTKENPQRLLTVKDVCEHICNEEYEKNYQKKSKELSEGIERAKLALKKSEKELLSLQSFKNTQRRVLYSSEIARNMQKMDKMFQDMKSLVSALKGGTDKYPVLKDCVTVEKKLISLYNDFQCIMKRLVKAQSHNDIVSEVEYGKFETELYNCVTGIEDAIKILYDDRDEDKRLSKGKFSVVQGKERELLGNLYLCTDKIVGISKNILQELSMSPQERYEKRSREVPIAIMKKAYMKFEREEMIAEIAEGIVVDYNRKRNFAFTKPESMTEREFYGRIISACCLWSAKFYRLALEHCLKDISNIDVEEEMKRVKANLPILLANTREDKKAQERILYRMYLDKLDDFLINKCILAQDMQNFFRRYAMRNEDMQELVYDLGEDDDAPRAVIAEKDIEPVGVKNLWKYAGYANLGRVLRLNASSRNILELNEDVWPVPISDVQGADELHEEYLLRKEKINSKRDKARSGMSKTNIEIYGNNHLQYLASWHNDMHFKVWTQIQQIIQSPKKARVVDPTNISGIPSRIALADFSMIANDSTNSYYICKEGADDLNYLFHHIECSYDQEESLEKLQRLSLDMTEKIGELQEQIEKETENTKTKEEKGEECPSTITAKVLEQELSVQSTVMPLNNSRS